MFSCSYLNDIFIINGCFEDLVDDEKGFVYAYKFEVLENTISYIFDVNKYNLQYIHTKETYNTKEKFSVYSKPLGLQNNPLIFGSYEWFIYEQENRIYVRYLYVVVLKNLRCIDELQQYNFS